MEVCRVQRASRGAVGFALLSLLAGTPAAHAQSAENVAVVVNDLSPESRRIGEHYARTRGLPASNVLRIEAPAEEQVERHVYLSSIERPLASAIGKAGLQDRLLYLVLTKGVPLRIAGTIGLKGTLASVDSELTLLYEPLLPWRSRDRRGPPFHAPRARHLSRHANRCVHRRPGAGARGQGAGAGG